MSIALTPEQQAMLAAAAATLRPSGRAAFKRDVMALMGAARAARGGH